MREQRQADKVPIPRMEGDGEQSCGKELQSSQLIYTIFMNLKDSESLLEKLERAKEKHAFLSCKDTCNYFLQARILRHTPMREQPCRSFLKLFTISSGSLAKELQRFLVWDVLSC